MMNNQQRFTMPSAIVSVILWCIFFATPSWALAPNAQKQVIDLPWVLQKTLLKNPRLQSYALDLRMLEARSIQAGIRPNPTLSVSIENVLGTGSVSAFRSAETNVSLSQLIELGDKRQHRIDVAAASQAQYLADYEVARLNVLSQATNAYYQVLRWQSLVSWSEQRINVEQRALTALEQRAQAGSVIAADVSRMALNLANSQVQQRQYRDQLQLAKYHLASQWASEALFEKVVGELNSVEQYPNLATALAALDKAPQYLSLLSQERLLNAKTALAKSKNTQDITLGVGLSRFEERDDSALMFRFSMPLSLTKPNAGNVIASEVAQEKAQQTTTLAATAMRLAVREIHQSMKNRIRQASDTEHTLLPLAHTLLKDTEQAYQVGRATVLQLLDAQNQVFNLERNIIEHNIAAMNQLLALESATGTALTQPLSQHLPVENK
mgnify:CR=1 FL=1